MSDISAKGTRTTPTPAWILLWHALAGIRAELNQLSNTQNRLTDDMRERRKFFSVG